MILHNVTLRQETKNAYEVAVELAVLSRIKCTTSSRAQPSVLACPMLPYFDNAIGEAASDHNDVNDPHVSIFPETPEFRAATHSHKYTFSSERHWGLRKLARDAILEYRCEAILE